MSGTKLSWHTRSRQKREAFSYAPAVIDRVGGWIVGNEEGSQIGARFAASMRIYTTVICNGQQHEGAFRINSMNSIVRSNQVGLCIFSRQPRLDPEILLDNAGKQNSGGIELWHSCTVRRATENVVVFSANQLQH